MKTRNTALLDQDELVHMVEEKLKGKGAEYRLMQHEPEGNCDKVSVLRGNHIHAAAKALLINVKKGKESIYVLSILPGDFKVDFKAIAKLFGGKSAGMADRSKVEELLQCEIGRVPPFSLHESVSLIVEESLVNDNQHIYFSPGRLDVSIEMKAADYRAMAVAENGRICKFGTKIEVSLQAAATLFAVDHSKAQAESEAKKTVELNESLSSLSL